MEREEERVRRKEREEERVRTRGDVIRRTEKMT